MGDVASAPRRTLEGAWPELTPSAWEDIRQGHEGHRLIRSYEPAEDWWRCCPDELFFETAAAPAAPAHP